MNLLKGPTENTFNTNRHRGGSFSQLSVVQQVAIDIALLENGGFYRGFSCFYGLVVDSSGREYGDGTRRQARSLSFDRARCSDVVSCHSFVRRLIAYCCSYWFRSVWLFSVLLSMSPLNALMNERPLQSLCSVGFRSLFVLPDWFVPVNWAFKSNFIVFCVDRSHTSFFNIIARQTVSNWMNVST